MAIDTTDTYIKGPAPTKNPDSQYTYLEQQLTSVEKAFKKQKQAIVDVSNTAQALYDKEVIVRATADTALSQTVETLSATVTSNNTTTQAQITNIQLAFADEQSATATKFTSLEAKVDTEDTATRALIVEEAKVRATKTEAIASKVSALEATVKTNAADSRALLTQEAIARATAVSAEVTSRTNLSAYVGYTDGQSYTKTLAASISDESIARVNSDGALAQKVTFLSSGSNRVWAQTTAPSGTLTSRVYYDDVAPSSSGRIVGDTWYDTSKKLLQYVWYNNAWQDNSAGTYSTQIGRLVGDIWYDTDDNLKQYVWAPLTYSGTTYDWRDNTSGAYSGYIGQQAAVMSKLYTLTTDDISQAGSATLLTARLGSIDTAISDEATARANADTSEATKRSTLSAYVGYTDGQSYTKTLTTAISDEATARANADTSEATKRTNLSSYVGYTDGQSYTKTLAASLSDEQTARATADSSLAQRAISTSAGTSRVYSQTTAPSSTGRKNGDIWIDTTVASGALSPNLTPYVWYGGIWNDNSSGGYSQYAGLNATVTQMSTVVNDPTNGLAYQWAVKGSAGTDSTGASALVLSGGRKANGSGGWTDYSRIVMSADYIEMNGNVIINGTLNGTKLTDGGIGTSKISDYAVSNNWYQQGTSGLTTKTIPVTAGNRYVIFAAYTGGQSSSSAGTATLDISYSYGTETVIQTMPVVFAGSGLVLFASYGYSNYTGSFVNGIGGSLNYTLPSAMAIASWTAPTTGNVDIIGKIYTSSNLGQPLHLYIVELKK